jgi:hypothetical protein
LIELLAPLDPSRQQVESVFGTFDLVATLLTHLATTRPARAAPAVWRHELGEQATIWHFLERQRIVDDSKDRADAAMSDSRCARTRDPQRTLETLGFVM